MVLPHQRLLQHAHNRLSEHRGDEAWESARWADPTTRVLVVAGRKLATPLQWVSPAQAPEGMRLLLGERDDQTYFAVITSVDEAGEDWRPLRALLPELAATDDAAPLVLHAIGMAEWLAATRFCPRCGGPLTPRASGHELVCSDGHLQFPRSDPAVIMLITYGAPGSAEEVCLLGRNSSWPPGRFSTLAGFCEPGESLEDAVRREVAEEAGVRVGEVQYFGNQPWPLPASLMLGFTGVALSLDLSVETDELEEARWVTREELLAGVDSGELLVPSGVSISSSLIESWLGRPLGPGW